MRFKLLLISAAFKHGVLCTLAQKVLREYHKLTQLCYAHSLYEAKLACSLCVRLWHRRDGFREYLCSTQCISGAEINSIASLNVCVVAMKEKNV